MRKIVISFSIIFIGVLIAATDIHAVDFVEKASFQITGLTEIDDLKFNDINLDGYREVFANDDTAVVLFSLRNDSLYFLDTLSAPEDVAYIRVLFKDVNRDLIPDMLIAITPTLYLSIEQSVDFIDGYSFMGGNQEFTRMIDTISQ